MRQARKLALTLLGLSLAVLLTGCPSPAPWIPFLFYSPSGVCPEGVQMTIRSKNPVGICRLGQGDDEPARADCKEKTPDEAEWDYTFTQKGEYILIPDEQTSFYTKRFQADWSFTCLGTSRPSLTFSQEVSRQSIREGYFLLIEDPDEPTGLRLETSSTLPSEDP